MKEKITFKKEMTWEQKANENPLYAIMSDDVFENKSTELNQDDLTLFYKKGELLWKRYLSDLINENEVPIGSTVLEFGCGMGRLLANPAGMGYNCIGIDISETQLSLAKIHFPEKSKTKFIKVDSKTAFDLPPESIDLIYSFAVFQHIKYLSDFYFSLSELTRVLKKGGLIRIQFRAPNKYSYNFKSFGFKTFNFENFSIIFYLKKFFGVPFPIVRLYNHNHWGGAGCYVSEKSIIKFLERKNLVCKTIRFDVEGQGIIWITAQKRGL